MTRARGWDGGNVRGVVLMVVGIALFALTDVTTKWLSAGYGAAQVIAMRCGTALLVAGPLAWREGGIAPRRLPLHLVRGALIVAAAFSFFLAFARLPLFEAYVVSFTAPFLTMALAIPFLGEQVGASAWGWAGLGFGGVVISAAPGLTGGGSPLGYAAALAGTASYAGMKVVTRRLGTGEGLAAAMAVPATMGVLVAGPFAAASWVAPSVEDAALLVLNGALWGTGNAVITAAVRAAEASRIAPIDFTAMVWALLFDAAFFGVTPRLADLAGAAIVVAACLGHQRDQRRGRA
ncbi:DMT family transporter [Elioraea sp.]|uniref:DMT family transporter n=1 Tax=Elioraea sp. TaxID=2185103 RepID=UPI003F7003EB